jgi:hypothetical protein
MEQLFAAAFAGSTTRDARPTRLPNAEEWVTIERSFTLQKKL